MKEVLLPIAGVLALTALIVIGVSPQFVSADEYGQPAAQTAMAAESMPMGKHSMGATIESIDHKTGFMKLKSGMGDMIIHYPPPAIKDLNKGDKITVNLSFTKDEGKMGDGMKMK